MREGSSEGRVRQAPSGKRPLHGQEGELLPLVRTQSPSPSWQAEAVA